MSKPAGEHSLYNLFLKDLICGSFAGLANVLSGHPFDSIKVRMQTSQEIKVRFTSVIRETWALEGVSRPLVTQFWYSFVDTTRAWARP